MVKKSQTPSALRFEYVSAPEMPLTHWETINECAKNQAGWNFNTEGSLL
jgi:hypothetical protein